MTAHRFPYMHFYARDFQDSLRVQAMSAEEMGCYIALLAAAWEEGNDCRLPDDDKILASICHVSVARWRKLKLSLTSGKRSVFEFTDDGFVFNGRQVEEWAKACDRSEALRRNGSKGGRPKRPDTYEEPDENQQVSDSKPDDKQSESYKNLIPDPISQNPKEQGDSPHTPPQAVGSDVPKPKANGHDSAFEAFWSAYPRKVGKQAALNVWSRWVAGKIRVGGAAYRADPEDLIAAARHYAEAKRGVADKTLIKHASTFLSAKDQPWLEWVHGIPDDEMPSAGPFAGRSRDRPEPSIRRLPRAKEVIHRGEDA